MKFKFNQAPAIAVGLALATNPTSAFEGNGSACGKGSELPRCAVRSTSVPDHEVDFCKNGGVMTKAQCAENFKKFAAEDRRRFEENKAKNSKTTSTEAESDNLTEALKDLGQSEK
jgi:hypothetical protein